LEARVFFTHEALAGADLRGWTAAVVDCLRATTTVAAALAAGARSVIPCEDEAQARSRDGALLAGERGTHRIPGFDLGNSPGDFTAERVRGRDVALATTNGTRAVLRAAGAGAQVVAFALVNVGAVAAHLSGCERLAVVCAGRVGGFGLDDAFAAGALLDRLAPAEMDDAARASVLLHLAGRADPLGFLRATAPGRSLARLGYGADVEFCARVDACPVLPVLDGGALRALAV
jgi:2-phosphosulfolactate phosphatase